MAFYDSPGALQQAVEAAVEKRRSVLSTWDRQRKEFHGPYWRGSGKKAKGTTEGGGTPDRLENHAWLWITRAIAEMCWQNPRIDTDTQMPGVRDWDALLLKVTLNQWTEDQKIAMWLARNVALDAQFNFGVAVLAPQPIPGMRAVEVPGLRYGGGRYGGRPVKRQPHSPRVYRISQRRYFEDPVASSEDEILFTGHDWLRSKESIEAEMARDPDAGWNMDLVRRMAEDGDYTELGRSHEARGSSRGEVWGRYIHVRTAEPIDPANTPAKGYNGVIYCIPGDGALDTNDPDAWLKDPVDFFGPPWGPHYKWGYYNVPDETTPLGPLTAMQAQADAHNAIARGVNRAGAAYKALVVVDDSMSAGGTKLAQQIRGLPDQFVFSAQNFDKNKITRVEVGGLNDQHLVQEDRAEKRWEKGIGLNETRQGMVTGEATATEVADASASGDTRFEWIERANEACTVHLYEGVAWYALKDPRFILPISRERAAELGEKPMIARGDDGEPVLGNDGQPVFINRPVWFFGGMEGRDDDFEPETLGVKIVPKSMSKRSFVREAQATLAFVQWLETSLPLIIQFPEVAWADVVNLYSEAVGLPKESKLIDWEAMRERAQQMVGFELQAGAMQSELASAPRAPWAAGGRGQMVSGGGGGWRGGAGPKLPGAGGARGLQTPQITQGGGAARPSAPMGASSSGGGARSGAGGKAKAPLLALPSGGR